MFTRVQLLYVSTKFIDGVSTVTRTIPQGADVSKENRPAMPAASAAASSKRHKAAAAAN